jgi:DNA-binding Xre family transcriptional regulator
MQIPLEPKRIAAVDFIGSVRRNLKQAIADSGMSAYKLAEKIGVEKLVLAHELNGNSDITAGRIAEICWAIGADVSLIVVGREKDEDNNGSQENSCNHR